MIRAISIEKDDILNDPEDAAKILSRALKRKIPMRFMGIHAPAEAPALLILLEECEESSPCEFVFSPLEADSGEEIIATVAHRHQAGYCTLATFRIEDSTWGLFARKCG